MSEHTDPIGANDQDLNEQWPTAYRIKAEFTIDVSDPEVHWWIRRLQGPPWTMTASIGNVSNGETDPSKHLDRFLEQFRRFVEEFTEPF